MWWDGVESLEPKNYVTSLMNVHVENGMQKGQNRSRDSTEETLRSLKARMVEVIEWMGLIFILRAESTSLV